MDQAASVISTPNSALYVSFFPRLSAEPIPLPGASRVSAPATSTTTSLPPGAVIVCANSLVVSDKLVHARTRYNLRVVETLVAARVLARKLSIPIADREKVTLREVLGRVVGEDAARAKDLDLNILKEGLKRMEREVEVLKAGNDGEDGVTLKEMIDWSGLSEELFREVYLSWVDGKSKAAPAAYYDFDPDSLIVFSRSYTFPALQTRQTRFHRSITCPSVPRSMPPCLFIAFFPRT
jgi:hypothetical protein